MMKHTFLHPNRAFTLIETLIAISILMLAVMGPLSIAASGLKNARFAREQVSASYLAQEGIEYVRYMRDNNKIDNLNGGNVNWLTGLTSCFVNSTSNYGCTIDVPKELANGSSVVAACPSSGCRALRQDSNGYYTYVNSGGSPSTVSPFVRTITIKPITSSTVGAEIKEVRVESTVVWTSGQTSGSFTVIENVFNK